MVPVIFLSFQLVWVWKDFDQTECKKNVMGKAFRSATPNFLNIWYQTRSNSSSYERGSKTTEHRIRSGCVLRNVAASGPTIWTSTYGLEPVLRNRLLIEPSGWAQTVHMFTQRFTQHVTQYSRRSLNAFFCSPFCACIYDLAEPYFISFRQ